MTQDVIGELLYKLKLEGEEALEKNLQNVQKIGSDSAKKMGKDYKKLNSTFDDSTAKTSTFKSALGGVKTLLAGLGITVGMTAILAFFKSSVNAAAESEAAEKKLTTALGRKSQALLDNAKALQKVTTYDDEAIINAQARIAAFTKDENIIKSLTKATLDFAAAKEIDLVTASDLLAKTLGSDTNALSRYGIEVTGAAGSTERASSIVKGITTLFGGQATSAANTYSGKIQQLKNKFGDLQEKIGNQLIPVLTSLAIKLDHMMDFVETSKFKKAWDFFSKISKFSPGNLPMNIGEPGGEGDFLSTGFDQYVNAMTKLQSHPTFKGPGIAQNDLNRLDQTNKVYKDTALTVDGIRAKIDELQISQGSLLPGSEKYEKIQIEIDKLSDQLLSKKEKLQKVEEEHGKALDEIIGKIQTENELKDLTTGLSIGVLETAKKTLENLLTTVKTDEDRLKILKEIKNVNDQIAERKPPELQLPDLQPEDIDITDQEIKRYEDRKKAEVEIRDLRIGAIDNEFERRKAQIEVEFSDLQEHYKTLYDNKTISEEEFQKASSDLESEKEQEISSLQADRYSKALSTTRTIANSLTTVFHDNTFVNNLLKALDIAEAIAAVLQSISILGSLFSTGGASVVAAIPKAKGGIVANINGKPFSAPYQRIPKFALGAKDFIVPPGFPNDSFLMALTSGEKANITPVNEVSRSSSGLSNGDIGKIVNAIQAMNMNLITAIHNPPSVTVVNNSPDVNTLVRKYKYVENQLARAGLKFNER